MKKPEVRSRLRHSDTIIPEPTMARTLAFALVCVALLALMAANGSPSNPQEAGRLNNIGVAYMNQQLFEKALKAFEEAAANDPTLEVTRRR